MAESEILSLDKRLHEFFYRPRMTGNPVISAGQDPEGILVALGLPDYGIAAQSFFYRIEIILRDDIRSTLPCPIESANWDGRTLTKVTSFRLMLFR